MSKKTLPRRLLVVLMLTFLAHPMLMTSVYAHDSPTDVQNAPIAPGHARVHISTNPADLASELAVDPKGQPASDECGLLTPWKTIGGEGGQRPERAAPIIVVSVIAIGSRPMPDELTHLYPPGVRRAFLQVYRN